MSNHTELLEKCKDIFDQIHEYLLDENHYVKEKNIYPPLSFLEKKSRLFEDLSALSLSLAALKENTIFSDSSKTLVKESQDKLLQLLILNRENEQALLYLGFLEQQSLKAVGNKPIFKSLSAYKQ